MSKKCVGCGLVIQNERPNEPGYSPKLDSDYCQSCYRLKHYGDVTRVNQLKVDPDVVLEKLRHEDALFVWVTDLYHLPESMVSGVARNLMDKDILLVGTKRELLPATVSQQKIVYQLQAFLKEANVKVVAMSIVANFGKDGREDLLELMEFYSKGRKIIFFGTTNAGKSTLLNSLTDSDQPISTSYLPGTTLEMIEVNTAIGKIIDSPGIQESSPIIDFLPTKALSILQPQKPIKPINYQVTQDQAFWVGGLGYIALEGAKDVSVTFYLPLGVNIHRTKLANADKQWERLQNDVLAIKDSPLKMTNLVAIQPKWDIVIYDVGFICISGDVHQVSAHFPQEVTVITRKAYI